MEIFKPTIQDQATFSGSVDISGSLTITQNLNVVGELQGAATTASYISLANVDGFTDVSSSIEQRISRQELFSGSLNNTFATDAELSSVSGALALSISNISTDFDDITNKPTLISSSAQIAADISGSFTELSSSLVADYLKNTSDTLTGDLTVTGTLTAQDLHVQEITSSIVYSSGSNTFGASSSDIQTLYGSVGIGTPSPSRKLQIKGTGNTALAITSPNTAYVQLALGDTDDDNYGQIILDNSTNKLQIQNGGGGVISDRGITLDSSENVGIGAVSPAAKFHVLGTTKLEGATTVTGGTLTTTSNINAGGSITAAASGYIELKADQTDTAAVRLGVSSGDLEAFVIADNTGAGHIVGNTSFKVMGYSSSTLTEYARFTSTGLGIKLATPSNNFQVGGDLNADNSAVWLGGGYVNNSLYHYADAPVGISGRWGSSGDNGAGITLMARNSASTNWYHGYISLKRDGNFYIGMNGLGTAQASDQVVLQRDGNVGIGTTSPAGKLEVRYDTTANNQNYIFSAYRTGANSSYNGTGLHINAIPSNNTGDTGISYLSLESRYKYLNGNHGTSAFITNTPGTGTSFGDGQIDFFIRNNTAPYTFKNDPNTTSTYWMDPVMTVRSDGAVLKPNLPGFSVYLDNSTTSNGNLIFTGVYYNTGNHYSTSSGRFTAPVAGTYFFYWGSILRTTSGTYRLKLHRNGSQYGWNNTNGNVELRGQVAASTSYETNASRVFTHYLNAYDYVEVALTTSPSSVGVYGDEWTYFGGYLLS